MTGIEAKQEKNVTLSLGLLLGEVVSLHALEEVLPAPRGLDVLNADVDPLLDDPVTDLLVDLDADSAGGHVPDDAGPAVVELERHTLVDRGVGLNVHIIADLVGGQVLSEGDGTVLPEGLREQLPGPGPVTEGVRHLVIGSKE